MIKDILIICIGNICRSPIAEALFALKFQKYKIDVTVSSAGVSALVGRSADECAQTLMQQRGIDITGHRARQASPELIFKSDLILTMTSDQQKQIEDLYPSLCGRVHRLGKWGNYDVPDPFKRPESIFAQALFLIDQGIEEWYRKLWN